MSQDEPRGVTHKDVEVVCAACGSWGAMRGWNADETAWLIDHPKQNTPCEVPRYDRIV
jgi:hypothetical protein